MGRAALLPWGPQQLALLIEAPAVELCMIPLPPCPPILPSGLFSLIESQTIKLHSLSIYSWRNHLFQGMRGSKRGSLSAPASLFLLSHKESDCVFLGACTATTIDLEPLPASVTSLPCCGPAWTPPHLRLLPEKPLTKASTSTATLILSKLTGAWNGGGRRDTLRSKRPVLGHGEGSRAERIFQQLPNTEGESVP